MKLFWRNIGQKVIPPILYLLMRLIWWTTRKRFHYITEVDERQHVCVCWHGELFMSPQAYRKIHKKHPATAMISTHFDGALIANTLKLFKIYPLRGSTRKGAKQVLLQAFRTLAGGKEVLITPDGPKGPRHSMNDGVVGLASRTHLPIFIMNFTATRYWQLGSWDKFVIPKPFSRVDFYLQSISIEGLALEEAKAYLSERMLQYTIV